VAALDAGVRRIPGFGMPQRFGGTTVEARIALIVRGRAEPIHLEAPRSRRSTIETTDEYIRVVRFLRSHGWAPVEAS
jgi:hypothetical protein